MKNKIIVIFLFFILIPNLAFASWWNPFSWFKKQIVQPPIVQVSVPVPTSTNNKQNDKQIEKEKVVIQKQEKQRVKLGSKQIAPATSAHPVISNGGGSGGVMVGPFPIDPTMPRSISDIQIINITNNSATITWVTKELANGKVSYSISPSFTQIVDCSSGYSSMTGEPCETSISPSSVAMEVVDSTKILNHSLNLNNLFGDTIYYFEVSSVWTNGSVTSTDHSFTTLK